VNEVAVRAARIEIFGFAKERREGWKQLAIDCQRMTNRLWQIWLCHHANAGSADKLRAHFEAYRQWQLDKNGDKPQWPCKALEQPLTASADARSFYRILSAEFPNVNVRTRGLLTNAWQSRLSQRKAASGSLPGWVSILFANESLPSFTRPQPIPFDKDNAKLKKVGDDYICELRIERLADGKSVVEPCQLMLGKRKCQSVRAIVDKILAGEYAWKGSNLLYDRGKWFAVISYEKPDAVREKKSYDEDKILYVRPGRSTRQDSGWRGSPWRIRIGNRSFPFGGNGAHIEHARRAIIRERRERKEHYRWSGSNQKGHGTQRADAVWTKLSSRWKDFTKRYNSEVSRRVIEFAKREGCGRIIYLQPRDSRRDSRLLSTLGNDGTSAMSWDYFQFGTMLASKCEEEGIEYGKSAKKPKAKPAANSVRGVRKAGKSVVRKRAGSSPAAV
jgi:hypothetical protein